MRDVTFDPTKRYEADDELDVTEQEAQALELPYIDISLKIDFDLLTDITLATP